MNYNILKLYVTKTSNLKFNIDRDNLIQILFFGENCNFIETYSNLNISNLYVKDLFYYKYRDQNIKVLNTEKKVKNDVKEINLKYGSVKPDMLKRRKNNFFAETTDIINKILEKYPNLRSSKIYLKTLDFFNLNKDYFNEGYKKILLYTIDLDKEIENDFKKRKFFIILRMLFQFQKNKQIDDLPFDDILLCLIKDSYPIYILIMKDKKFKLEKVISGLKKIKKKKKDENIISIEEVFNNDENEKENLEIVKDLDIKEEDLDNKDISKIKKILSKNKKIVNNKQSVENNKNNDEKNVLNNDNNNEHRINNNISNDKDKLEVKKIIVKSVVKKITGNKEASEDIYNKIKNIDKNETLDVVLKQVKKDFFNKYEINTEDEKPNTILRNMVIKNSNILKAVDNKVPSKIISKRKEDFNTRLKEHIYETFKMLEQKDYPLIIEDFYIEDHSSSESEIKKSTFNIVKIKLKEKDTDKSFDISIKVPKIIDNNYFYLNGIKKIIVNQLIQIPILFFKPYICKIQTNYATITIEERTFKNIPTFDIYIGGFKLPLLLVCFYYFGFKRSLDLFGIKYRIISKEEYNEKVKQLKNIFYINDKYYLFENINEPYKEILINFLRFTKLYKNEQKFEFESREYFQKWIQTLTGNLNSLFIIREVLDNIIDNISYTILDSKGLPVTIDNIFLYVVKKLPTGFVQDSNDLDLLYLRTSDIITHMLMKQVITSYNHYKAQKLISDTGDFIFNSNDVFSKLQTSGIVQTAEYINPYEELSYFTRVTYSGFGGLNKDNVSVKNRNLNRTYFNNICPVDTPEGGSIGVINHLTVDSNIVNNNGIFGIKEISKNPNSGIFSTSVSVVPFSDRDEPTRLIMSSAQTKQIIPLVNAQIPAVMTGYDFLLTPYLSDNFIKKSPVDGEIIYYDEDTIKIKENKTNKVYEINMSGVNILKSGLNVNIESQFKLNLPQNKKVKKGDIIAYGTGINDGIISTGANLLVAFMNYKGYVFEDGIVIREGIAKNDSMLSKHIFELEVVLKENDNLVYINDNIGSDTEKGDILLTYVPQNISDVIYFEDSESNIDVLKNTINLRSVGGKIVDIFVAPNVPLIKFEKISKLFEKQKNKARVGSYTYKDEHINGIYIKFTISKSYRLDVGDKMANRHGAKGIITYIEKDEYMPRTPWGQPIDIITNQIGIINRMNLGQFFEMYCGLISYKMGEIIINNGESKRKQNIDFILKIYKMLDNSKDKIIYNSLKNFYEKMNSKQYSEFYQQVKKNKFIPLIFPPLQTPTNTQIKNVMEYLNIDSGYKLFLPEFNNITTKDKIPVGYCYFNKLEHIAEKKLHSRSLGKYKKKTNQPTAGKAQKGGQRIGEGDSYCLLSWGADNLIKEFFGPLSDDFSAKKHMYNNIIRTGNTNLITSDENNATNELVRYYLKIVGLLKSDD